MKGDDNSSTRQTMLLESRMETAEILNFEDPEAYKLHSDGSETHKSTDDDRMMQAVLIGEHSRLTNMFKSTASRDLQINASD